MAIDYARLVAGLSAVATMIDEGRPGPAALEALVGAARQATGAGGATYTEYVRGGGRVIVASGSMGFAVGQPVEAGLVDVDQPAVPVLHRVDLLPAELAEPLLRRGLVTLAGSGVRADGRAHGAVHVYFGELDPQPWREIQDVLRVVADSAVRAYPHPAVVTATGGMAEQEDRALFLAVAGHELRTPVTVLKGYAGMLADRWQSLDESDRRESAQILSQRADELARLVDRLLRASVDDGAPGASATMIRTVAFNPVTALHQAVVQLPSELRRSVRVELPDSLPPAVGDPSVLFAVVAELVTNAVRYSPADPVVELQGGADPSTVVIRVCDRGVGIEPAQVELAFERFWRARRDGDPRGGVGLGLYLVRRLVERQKGWVSLRPREGGGTVAEVRLPRADGPTGRVAPGEA